MDSMGNTDEWDAITEAVRQLLPTEMERNRMARYFPLMHNPQWIGSDYIIEVDEPIQVEMFSNLYGKLIDEVLLTRGFEGVKTVFKVNKNANNNKPKPLPQYTTNFTPENPTPVEPVHCIPSTLPLHEQYTFESFVRGPSNSFALAAAVAVAENRSKNSYNPLFIYGGTGLGKTHLMEAIGHYVMRHNPTMSVCFITSETFLNEYVNAIQNNSMPAFRERYRKVDLLLLDDVQFIAGTEKFQEEFFNTFNSLMLTHKQVVMTSDVAPKDLKGCEERLTGRFQQGMVVEIEEPSLETRMAILQKKAFSTGKIVPEEILRYIAENVRSHVRALEGALNRVVTFMEVNRSYTLTIDLVHHLLRDTIENEKMIKDLTVKEIMKAVADHYGVKIEDILSKERTQNLVTPRQVSMFLSRTLTTLSLPAIADAFNKTHATVHHGTQTIQKRLDVEPQLLNEVEQIVNKLGRKISDIYVV